ncbi:MAG: hypothetical protein LC808_34540 [Actinobacteria bacterium]|nr:hypothetical protein [Actinomycetota bacterium]
MEARSHLTEAVTPPGPPPAKTHDDSIYPKYREADDEDDAENNGIKDDVSRLGHITDNR